MFKEFFANKEYSFDLDGNFIHKGIKNLDSDYTQPMINVEIHNQFYRFSKTWLSLICHYKVDMQFSDLMKIAFIECKSKVLGIRCKNLMTFKSRINYRDRIRN